MDTVAQSNGTVNTHALLFSLPTAQPPEAALSLNGYVHVSGLSERVQVTARSVHAGETAADVAARLKAGMDAVQAQFAPPAPKSRTERIAALLACGLAKAVAKGDYDLVCRLSKAAALVLSGAVSTGERAGMLAVRSQEDASQYYEVDDLACSCPDYERKHRQGHSEYLCKHSLASWMSRKLGEVS